MQLFGRKEEGITPESLQRAVAEGVIDSSVTIEQLRRSLSGKSPVEQMILILKQFVPPDKRCEFKALPRENFEKRIPHGVSEYLKKDFENMYIDATNLLALPIVFDGYSSRHDERADHERDAWTKKLMDIFGSQMIQGTLRLNILRRSFWNNFLVSVKSITQDEETPEIITNHCAQLLNELEDFLVERGEGYDYVPLQTKLELVLRGRETVVKFLKKFPRA